MKSYLDFAKDFGELLNSARSMPVGEGAVLKNNCKASKGLSCESGEKQNEAEASKALGKRKKVLIFAPHPDDECIIGLFALRLANECGADVVNVAITLGSNSSRRMARLDELKAACNFLGWGLRVCGNEGFESADMAAKKDSPEWKNCLKILADIIEEEKPDIIFAPNPCDWNKTHINVARLVEEALEISKFKACFVNTEYWGAMNSANLLLEASCENLADLMSALACHEGEVARNDYHVRLPAYFADNVRRGGEIVGGQGKSAPNFNFGAIYNVLKRGENGVWIPAFDGTFFASGESFSKILPDF